MERLKEFKQTLNEEMKKLIKDGKLGKLKDAVSNPNGIPESKEENYEDKMCRLVKEALFSSGTTATCPLVPKKVGEAPPESNANLDPTAKCKLREQCQEILAERIQRELPLPSDLDELNKALEQHYTPPLVNGQPYILYVDYLKAQKQLHPRIKSIVTATVFMQLVSKDDPYRRAPAVQIFNYVVRKTLMEQMRWEFSRFDKSGKGVLSEDDLDAFLLVLIPSLPQLANMDPDFLPFYICTVSRKFFFFLDPQRRGKIKIIDILASGLMDDLMELQGRECCLNWFSMQSVHEVYQHFIALDKDQNGMLSKEEFLGYNLSLYVGIRRSHILNKAFVEQLFIRCMTYEGGMDFRTYVDFVLAMENKNEPQSLSYFFRMLDIDGKGYLDAFDLHYFYKDVVKVLGKYKCLEIPTFSDVKDEIFDMVKPTDPLKITLKDLTNCGSGETVVNMLIDAKGFNDHDDRENIPINEFAASKVTLST